MQVYFYGTCFGTITAKGRGKTQVFKFFNALQVWSDHTAYGAAVSSAITVAANIFIHRAGIKAGNRNEYNKDFPVAQDLLKYWYGHYRVRSHTFLPGHQFHWAG